MIGQSRRERAPAPRRAKFASHGEPVGSRIPDLLTRLPGYVGENNRVPEPVFDFFKTQALACRFLDTDKDHDLDMEDFADLQASFTGPNDVDERE